jgi:ubiquinone/menaquinone biosynthesis C-methylase UbiE
MDQHPAEKLAGMIGGYFLSQAIHVAARLGIADLLRDGPQYARQLAHATGAHARSLHRLLRSLAGFGIFAEDGAGRFQLTDLAEWLRSDVPGSLRAQALCVGDTHYAAFGELLYSVETGRPGFVRAFGMPLFDYFAVHHEAARTFDVALVGFRTQATEALLAAYDFSGFTRVVDVGGGTGGQLAAVLARYGSMKGILFDLPHVIAQAGAALDAAGVRDRCELVGGDFFESITDGADVYLLRHILHDWEDKRALRLLQNCRRAMTRPGKLLLVESVIRPGNEPSAGKVLDLVMLALTGGMERTEPEYRELLEASGFRLVRVVPAVAEIDILEAEPIGR